MSSILTNNGAMVALQTLKSINSSLAKTQDEISTGKSIATAKDNSSIWAISKTMESDVAGFKAIGDSLAQGQSTVSTARNAAESITDLLKEIKTKVVAGTKAEISEGERDKLQTDIDSLRSQIASVVSSAQFSGQNLINGASSDPIKILSSLDRSNSGVTANYIDVSTFDMRSEKVSSFTPISDTVDANDGTDDGEFDIDFTGLKFSDAIGGEDTASVGAIASTKDNYSSANLLAGDNVTVKLGGHVVSYTVQAGDGGEEVSAGLAAAINAAGIPDITAADSSGELTITNASLLETGVEVNVTRGQMGGLSVFDVKSEDGAKAFLDGIETMIQSSINTAAAFGSVERRIEIQSDFLGKLSDTMKAGISAMVDANLEEASARLQALQVQQQLGVQALSIANQAPQTLLALFR